jgi:hypothetical protein
MRVKEMRCHTPDALPLELLRLVDLKLHNQLIDALKLMIWEWHFGFPLHISSQWWCAESLRARPLDSEPQWTSKAKQQVFFSLRIFNVKSSKSRKARKACKIRVVNQRLLLLDVVRCCQCLEARWAHGRGQQTSGSRLVCLRWECAIQPQNSGCCRLENM